MADAAEEVYDVVDANNNVVGTATRHECHSQALLHRTTHVFLFRRQDASLQVLLQRRAVTKKIGANLLDVSVAEHVNSGENYEQAARRGLREELGVTVGELRRLGGNFSLKMQWGNMSEHVLVTTFAAQLEHDHVRLSAEVGGVEWMNVETAHEKAAEGEKACTRWLLAELDRLSLFQVGMQVT